MTFLSEMFHPNGERLVLSRLGGVPCVGFSFCFGVGSYSCFFFVSFFAVVFVSMCVPGMTEVPSSTVEERLISSGFGLVCFLFLFFYPPADW